MKVNCWYFYYNIYFYIFIVFYFEDQYLPISATLTNATIKDQGGRQLIGSPFFKTSNLTIRVVALIPL